MNTDLCVDEPISGNAMVYSITALFAICRFENGDQMFDYVILFDSDDFLDEGNVCTACCDHKASIIKTNKKSCGPL